MRKLMTLLVALIASTSVGYAQVPPSGAKADGYVGPLANPGAATALPGPAAQGWYVIMGESPSWSRGHKDDTYGRCKAIIVPADYQVIGWSITERKPYSEATGEPLPDYFLEANPKRYGPFNSRFDAGRELMRSGWTELATDYWYLAPKGC